jgi:hypothetical protein
LKAAVSLAVGGLLPTPPVQFGPVQFPPAELVQLTVAAGAKTGITPSAAAAEAIHRAYPRRPIRHVRLFMVWPQQRSTVM